MFYLLPDFCYERHNTPDIAHNLSRVFVMNIRILVGSKEGGVYKGWNRDNMHRWESEIYNVFPQVWKDASILPWRLNREDLNTVDERVRRIVYPHLCETIGSLTCSFWLK